MAINTNYYNYSSALFGQTNNVNSFFNPPTSFTGNSYGSYQSGYGTNNADAISTNIQKFLTEAKSKSDDMKAALFDILGKAGKGSSVFDKKSGVSGNTDFLAIKSTDAKKVTTNKAIDVKINQVATAQKNVGTSLAASEISSVRNGTNYVGINVGGKDYTVSFEVKAGDNNQAVQQKLADAINKRNLGVTASVKRDGSNSSLTLASSQTGQAVTGKDENFTITDVQGSNAVSVLGIGKTTEYAQDAKYSVNGGEEQTSRSNDVEIGNGITATLKKATTDDVSVTMQKDSTAQLNTVRSLVNSFNGLLSAAEDNSLDAKTIKLYNSLQNASRSYSSALDKIGIERTKDGYFKIDEDKMKAAAENGDLEKFFKPDGGFSNFGFTSRLKNIAENVSSNPASYATTSTEKSVNMNYMQSARYNQWLNAGLLFDSLF